MARRRRPHSDPPIALAPVDLLAGLAPGLTLTADDLPAGVADAEEPTLTEVTVNDVGRQLRCDEPTVRRLIRTRMLRPKSPPTRD